MKHLYTFESFLNEYGNFANPAVEKLAHKFFKETGIEIRDMVNLADKRGAWKVSDIQLAAQELHGYSAVQNPGSLWLTLYKEESNRSRYPTGFNMKDPSYRMVMDAEGNLTDSGKSMKKIK